MTKEEEIYIETGKKMKEAEQSQMFGKPCFKINGKAFICFFQNEMVFKLTGNAHTEALQLPGSRLFDPSGKSRPMKEWVQVAFSGPGPWEKYARAAFDYVRSASL